MSSKIDLQPLKDWDKRRVTLVRDLNKKGHSLQKKGMADSRKALSLAKSHSFRFPGLSVFSIGPWGAILLLLTLLASMTDD